MPRDMSLRDERRGTRHLLVGGVIAALAIGICVVLWSLFVPAPSTPTATTGTRTDQTVGQSTAAIQAPPPPSATPHATAPIAVGRIEDIAASVKNDLGLNPDQRKTVEDFAVHHAQDRVIHADFAIAVGATVPSQVQLRDMPISLADALSAYLGDQYLLVPNQFIIVEKETRRIVAIIPVSA